MESPRCVLINAAWQKWYPLGTDRLVRSLHYHGWNYEIWTWKNENINEYFDPRFPYTIKAAAFAEAVREGFDCIMWLDCSAWAVKDPNPVMKEIIHNGSYFLSSGYNLAQTASDADLYHAEMSRDRAERLPELWSCIFGVDMRTDQGKIFAREFLAACDAGVFNTPREHSGLSEDPRFLHARQDQTAATIAYYKAGYTKMHAPGEHICYYADAGKHKDNACYLMRGM